MAIRARGERSGIKRAGSRTGRSPTGYSRLKHQYKARTGKKPGKLRKLGYAAAIVAGGPGAYVYSKAKERHYEKTGKRPSGKRKAAYAAGTVLPGVFQAMGVLTGIHAHEKKKARQGAYKKKKKTA
jgi:hypothetical protein